MSIICKLGLGLFFLVKVSAFAHAQLSPFRIATSPIGESLVLYAARDLGWFNHLPFQVVVEATTTTDVSGLLASGAITAHTFPSSAIPAAIQGRVCAQMVLPLSKGFAQSVIAKRPLWSELSSGSVAVYALPSVAASFVEELAREHMVSVEQKAIRFFTADRVRRVLTDEGLVATHASHPHAAYAQYVRGLTVLSRPGDGPDAVHVGLFVRCADVVRGGATEHVVQALRAFVTWSVKPTSKKDMLGWIDLWLSRGIHEKFSRSFEGLPLAVAEVPLHEVAERIYDDYVRSAAIAWPSLEGEALTVRFALGSHRGAGYSPRDVFNPLLFK